jgi:hypothetical protein
MNNQATPDAAVEAAAKRIAGHYGAGVNNWEWYLVEAREILEAAAPHLLAEALDEAAMDFELSPHNSRGKMARHFNNAYVAKLRERAYELRAAK